MSDKDLDLFELEIADIDALTSEQKIRLFRLLDEVRRLRGEI